MAKKNEKPVESAEVAAPVAEPVVEPTADAAGTVVEAPVEPTANAEGTVAEPTADAAGTVAEAPVEPSKRDNFRSRISKRYPDLNMDDEDAYYDQMGGMMDEYEGYEKNSQRLRDHMSKTPAFAEMLLAAREQDDFDPVVWMVRERGLDLQSAMDDPEYAEKIAKARSEYMEKEAKGRETLEAMKTNLPKTLEATKQALEDAGMGEKVDDVIAQIFQFADDVTTGTWNPDVAVMIAKGAQYDNAVADARDEGMAAGLNKKVDDKLRKLDAKKERVSGTQTPAKPKEPKKASNNMFMA